MIVITTHVNADFDCLASMVAATKIYPDAVILFPGSQEKNVRDFLEKTGFPLPIKRLKGFDLKKIKKLVIVDCATKERLGPLGALCGSGDLPIDIYDHHPESVGNLKKGYGKIAPRGANTTLMVELMREGKIEITPEEATLFMLGIYEDTGMLTFTSTTPYDFAAAQWLLTRGASLNIVSDFLNRALNSAQIKLLHQLVNSLGFHEINGVEIAIATATSERYVGDLAVVIHSLKDMENLSAIFTLVEMEGRLHLIIRSRIPAVDAGAIAAHFDGGGHPTAASATVRDMLLDDARLKLLEILNKAIPPAPTAEMMMVAPVISVGENDSLKKVEEILTRYNFNALPVTRKTEAVGIITRQIVEKALFHKLSAEKAKDYMQTEFAQVTKETPSETVKVIVIRQKQKIVPVVNEKREMIGIVGRSDVMRAMYGDILKSPASMLQPKRKIRHPVSRDLSGLMRDNLPADTLELLKTVSKCADDCGYTAYVVGGFVRDLLMRRANLDVDVVIEGDGISFANSYVERHGGRVKAHKKFATAIMVLKSRRKIDIATARTEYYTEPAALPIVEMSSIKNDLYRRDFTINALAIKLNGSGKNHLIDFFGGQQDLKDGALRVLHNLSFVEDPTRIFRAIRFEQRFNFAIGGQTNKLLQLAVRKGLVDKISGSRLFGELKLIFEEEEPPKAIKRIAGLGLWKLLNASIKHDEKMHHLCEQAREAIMWHELTFDSETTRPWLVYLLCLASGSNDLQRGEIFKRLGFAPEPSLRFVNGGVRAKEAAPRLEKLTSKMPVEIFETLNGLEPEVLLALMAATQRREAKRAVAEYMTHIRHVKPKVNGGDLKKAGITEGPLMGRTLEAIRMENLKNALPTKSDEISFAKNFYRILKENQS